MAVAGGRWFMFNYYLAITQWKPNFRKKSYTHDEMYIWAQLIDLPVEYFQYDALFKLAKLIGRPIKMDVHTSTVTRGRYARMCVEVDLHKQLPLFVYINNIKQDIAYELNQCFCRTCGKIGHFPSTGTVRTHKNQITNQEEGGVKASVQEWTIIEKRRTRPPLRRKQDDMNMDQAGKNKGTAKYMSATQST